MLIIEQTVAVLLVFGLVVFIHELGHFLAAKRAGVYAPRFSIGFGPPLWSRKWGETEYVIAAIPLGGYVRMASREDDSMAAIEGGGEKGLDIPPDRYFEAKSLPTRLGILLAGVTMNVVLGFVILTGLAYTQGREWPGTRMVKGVEAVAQAPALAAAVMAGDTLVSIDGRPIHDWGDVYHALVDGHANQLTIATQRGSQTVALSGDADSARHRVLRAIDFQYPAVIGDVIPDLPADLGGLSRGDTILSANGQPITTWESFVQRIRGSPDTAVALVVSRGGVRKQLKVTPQQTPESESETKGHPTGQIGVTPIAAREQVGFGEAVVAGWRATWGMAGLIVVTLKKYFSGQMSLKTLQGPVGIVRQTAAAARQGIGWVLQLLAALSINVAVLNLLPIPILDGGQITMNIIESAKGSAFTMRTREYLLRFGFAALALLFVIVMYNDVVGLVRRLLHS